MGEVRQLRLGTGIVYVEMDEAEIIEQLNPISAATDRPDDSQLVSYASKAEEAADALRSTINALAGDVARALAKAAPQEWTLEVNIGFKGKMSPIPVIISGEGSSALKLTAKWLKS